MFANFIYQALIITKPTHKNTERMRNAQSKITLYGIFKKKGTKRQMVYFEETSSINVNVVHLEIQISDVLYGMCELCNGVLENDNSKNKTSSA